MKKIILLLILFISIRAGAQCSTNSSIPNATLCITNNSLYTKTTDPDDNSTYAFTNNTFNYNLNPNGLYGPVHFNWMTQQSFYVTTATSVSKSIYSPFYPVGNSPTAGGYGNNNLKPYEDINLLQNITTPEKLKRMDILASDGWELLKYNFGTPSNPQATPYFVLYNRYTGKLKYFAAITSETQGQLSGINNAIVKVSTNPPGQYDLFANAKPFTHIFSDFNHNDGINAAMTNYFTGISGNSQYYWIYAEFNISYDPCVCRQLGPATSLQFEIAQVQQSAVNLNLKGSLTALNTNTSYAATTVKDNAGMTPGNNLFNQAVNAGKAAIKGYKDWEGYAKEVKDYFNSKTSQGTAPPSNDPQLLNLIVSVASSAGYANQNLQTQTQITYSLINGHQNSTYNPTPVTTSKFVQTLAGLAPLVNDLASAAPYVGAFIALYNFFSDAGQDNTQTASPPPPAPPTAYALEAKIEGSITHTSGIGYPSNFQVPGYYLNVNFSQSGCNNEQVPYPIYNNPLGVFTIIDVPNFEFKSIPLTNSGTDPNDPNLSYTFYDWTSFSAAVNNPGNFNKTPFGTGGGAFNYKLTGPVSYAINPASRLKIHSIDAAYVLEYKGDESLVMKTDASLPATKRTNSYYDMGSCFLGCYWYDCTYTLTNNSFTNKQVPYFPYNSDYVEFPPSTGVVGTNVTLNNIFSRLNTLGWEIEGMSDNYTDVMGGNSNSEYLRIRTKYVPLESIQNIDFVLVGAAKTSTAIIPNVYLKLFCKFDKLDKPGDEPVTMILTYDITGKLMNAQNVGTAGGGSYFYYFAKDRGNNYNNCGVTKPGDYTHFGGLTINSNSYPNTFYTSNSSPITISSSTPGSLANANISVSSGVTLNSNVNGIQSVITSASIIFGDNCTATCFGSNPSTNKTKINAGVDIIAGRDFIANATGASNLIMTAGNDIRIDKNFIIGSTNPNVVNIYAGHDIKLGTNTGSSYNAVHSGAPKIINSNLYAQNEIEILPNNSSSDVEIIESEFSTKKVIPNTYAIVHGADAEKQVEDLHTSAGSIATLCTNVMSNREATPLSDTSAHVPVTIKNHPPVQKTDSSVARSTILDLTDEISLTMYPNPTGGEVNLNIYTPVMSDFVVTVEELTGKIIFQDKLSCIPGSTIKKFEFNDLVNGMYLIKLSDVKGSIVRTQRFVLQRN